MNRSPMRGACRRALVLLAFVPLAAAAQTMKPGLWEIQQQMQLDAAQQKQMDEMRKQMAAMPEAQRKQIEQMMGKHGMGVDLASGGSKVKVCLSAADVARDAPPGDARTDCRYDGKRSGATQQIKYVCTQPPAQGDIEITAVSAERYTMKMKGIDGKTGKPVAMQGEGRWLGADCGGIKPASEAARK